MNSQNILKIISYIVNAHKTYSAENWFYLPYIFSPDYFEKFYEFIPLAPSKYQLYQIFYQKQLSNQSILTALKSNNTY